MRTTLAALALVLVVAVAVIAYIALNNSEQVPTPSPSPTLPATPNVPTELNALTVGWGDPTVKYPNGVAVVSPQNTTYKTSNLTLTVNVTTAFWVINSVYYKADWLGDYHRIYTINYQPVIGAHSQAITINVKFTGIPDGNHTILVLADYHDYSYITETASFSVNTSAAK